MIKKIVAEVDVDSDVCLLNCYFYDPEGDWCGFCGNYLVAVKRNGSWVYLRSPECLNAEREYDNLVGKR